MTAVFFRVQVGFGIPSEGQNADDDGEEHLDDECGEAESDGAVSRKTQVLCEGCVRFEIAKAPNARVGEVTVDAGREVDAAWDDHEGEEDVEEVEEV